MKKFSIVFTVLCCILILSAKLTAQDLPHHMTEEERLAWPAFYQAALMDTRIVSPPPGPLRTPGEWEEQLGICITWTSYTSILREIVKYAQMECKVIIHCTDSNTVKSNLTSNLIPLTSNLIFIEVDYNSIWIRDYGAQSVYQNDVGNLYLVDWKYNRPRDDDDVMPMTTAAALNIPIYEMNASPYLLVSTGGNLMWDGFGTVMSSELILQDNSSLTETQINTRMNQYFGTSRYIKFDVLPYDGIHHIDMHMKLLDEETVLLGQYPAGISDGPQIEANLLYLQNNFNSVFGTPYKIIRIPMPPNLAGTGWPSNGSWYRTYTNGVFINKTFIYPTYYTKYDTTALRIYKEALPGYKLIGIDSDTSPNDIISQSGSIHCITSNIAVHNPLLISHKRLGDSDTLGPFRVDALIKHNTGITSATLYHTNDTSQAYLSTPMTLTNAGTSTWTGYIPSYPAGSTVFYYIGASATSGKTQVRPITAPNGFWKFKISVIAGIPQPEPALNISLGNPFPNPARAITCIPVESSKFTQATLGLYDMNGRLVEQIHQGELKPGTNNFFFNAMDMNAGVYYIRLETEMGIEAKKVVVYGY